MIRRLAFIVCLLGLLPSPASAADAARHFTLSNGLKVIHIPLPGNDVVALQFVMPGSSSRQTKQNAGIESLLLESMIRGSEAYPKEETDRELDRMGAVIAAVVEKDFSSLNLLCVRPFFDRSLDIFAEAWKHPLLLPEEVELAREKQLARIRARRDSPEEYMALVLNERFYDGHPYRNDPLGTLQSVSCLTVEQLRGYHDSIRRCADHFIVVVGRLSEMELRPRLEKAFGEVRRSRLIGTEMPAFTPHPNEMVLADMDIPTKYILGKFPAPAPGEKHYAALKIGLKVLKQRLWDEVRAKSGLAYAVTSGLGESRTNYGYVFLTTDDETKAMPIIFNEVKRLTTEPIPEDELKAARSVHRTEYYKSIESNSGQEGFLALGEIHFGDYRKRHFVMDRIQGVKPAEIQEAAEKHLGGFTFAVVGPTKSLDTAVFRARVVNLR